MTGAASDDREARTLSSRVPGHAAPGARVKVVFWSDGRRVRAREQGREGEGGKRAEPSGGRVGFWQATKASEVEEAQVVGRGGRLGVTRVSTALKIGLTKRGYSSSPAPAGRGGGSEARTERKGEVWFWAWLGQGNLTRTTGRRHRLYDMTQREGPKGSSKTSPASQHWVCVI